MVRCVGTSKQEPESHSLLWLWRSQSPLVLSRPLQRKGHFLKPGPAGPGLWNLRAEISRLERTTFFGPRAARCLCKLTREPLRVWLELHGLLSTRESSPGETGKGGSGLKTTALRSRRCRPGVMPGWELLLGVFPLSARPSLF